MITVHEYSAVVYGPTF